MAVRSERIGSGHCAVEEEELPPRLRLLGLCPSSTRGVEEPPQIACGKIPASSVAGFLPNSPFLLNPNSIHIFS